MPDIPLPAQLSQMIIGTWKSQAIYAAANLENASFDDATFLEVAVRLRKQILH